MAMRPLGGLDAGEGRLLMCAGCDIFTTLVGTDGEKP